MVVWSRPLWIDESRSFPLCNSWPFWPANVSQVRWSISPARKLQRWSVSNVIRCALHSKNKLEVKHMLIKMKSNHCFGETLYYNILASYSETWITQTAEDHQKSLSYEKFDLWVMVSLCFGHVATIASPFYTSVFHFKVKFSKICEIFLSCE